MLQWKESKIIFEKTYLTMLLRRTKGHMTRAAELSGQERSALYARLKVHNLNPADYRTN